MTTEAQEEAVRDYLTALKDPASMVDEQRVHDIEHRLQETDDQIERVKLQQELQEVRNPSLEQFEERFVTHAKEWADRHGITAAAFRAEGVSDTTLRRAGFPVGGRGRAGRRTRKQTTPRKQRVSAEDVRAAIPQGTFTVNDVVRASGGSLAVARRVVREEVEKGTVTEHGPDPSHSGPGRAPILFER